MIKMDSVFFWKVYALVVFGVCCVGVDEMSVMEGNSITLRTNVTTNQHEKIKWFLNNTRLAEINEEYSKICTDHKCKERFGNRLKLDHQTGSLTITNTKTTDSGLYLMEIINSGSDLEKLFSVTVQGISDAEQDEIKGKPEKEGKSDPGLSTAAVAGIICVAALLIVAVIGGVIYCRRNCQAGQNGTRTRTKHRYQVTNANEEPQNGNANASETV